MGTVWVTPSLESITILGAARGVQGQRCLDGHVYSWSVEGPEHELSHLLTVGLGIQGALGQQHRVLLRGHTRLITESGVSDFLHVNPTGDGAMLDGVLEGQDATLALGLATHVSVFLPHAHMMLWCQGCLTMDGNTARGASSPAKPALHMPVIVNDECSAFFFHCDQWRRRSWGRGTDNRTTRRQGEGASCNQARLLKFLKGEG